MRTDLAILRIAMTPGYQASYMVVYAGLSTYARFEPSDPEFGWAFPKISQLAQTTGLGERTVSRALAWLEDHGLVIRRPRYRTDGRQTSTKYWLAGGNPPQEPVPLQTSLLNGDATGDTPRNLGMPPGGEPAMPPGGEPIMSRNDSTGNDSTRTSAPTKETWLTPYWDAWKDRFGGDPPAGILSKFLRPLDQEYGPERLTPAWASFLSEVDVQYMGTGAGLPAKFATTVGVWLGDKSRGGKPEAGIYDEPTLNWIDK